MGLSRQSAYDAAARGDLPTLRVGRRLLVPTAALRRLLALDDPRPAGVPLAELPDRVGGLVGTSSRTAPAASQPPGGLRDGVVVDVLRREVE